MNRPAVAAAAGLVLALLVCSCGKQSAPEAGAGKTTDGQPMPKVRTAPVERLTMLETVEGYGSTAAAPGSARTVSVSFEARVRRVLVTEGTPVGPGTALVEIEPSAETSLQLAEARDETTAATEQRKLAQERLALKLATIQDLQQAEQRLRAAEVKQRNLESREEAARILRADIPGVVAHVDAQPGQILAPGTSLLQLVRARDITARLGMEAADAPRVHTGQTVRLTLVNGPDAEPIEGRVEIVADAVNPQTRLVDVFVRPHLGARLRLNQYVRCTIEIGRHEALVVPREAVLPDRDASVLFSVENGHAVRHVVHTGLDDGRVLELKDAGLAPGTAVVVQGNAELQDGMPVEVDGSR